MDGRIEQSMKFLNRQKDKFDQPKQATDDCMMQIQVINKNVNEIASKIH